MDDRALLQTELFTHHVGTFAQPTGPDLLRRTEAFFEWQDTRRELGLWPYSRSLDYAPTAECVVRNESGEATAGINFASQDYLGLASHPAIAEAAHRAIRDYGPHSAGSGMFAGNTTPSLRLEKALGEALEAPYVALFSSGWGAGFGVVTALVRPSDHVVMDALAHSCLQTGAAAATQNVHRFRHLDNGGVRRRLHAIRSRDAENGILVVTEGLFSMDSDVPAIEELQGICREYGATLLVDMAHDFGARGPRGTGSVGAQEMLGKVDLVMGAFSKTFASNGGYVASRSAAVRQYVRVFGAPHIFSNAISPVQATVVREALEIVRSDEGDHLRERLMHNVNALRNHLARRGIQCIGIPSAVVPVPIGDAPTARIAGRLVAGRHVFANLVEFPAVPLKGARFRMQVMATHTDEQVHHAASVVADAIAEARAYVTGEVAEAAREEAAVAA
ncbi:MAG TPA: aminotransferase class I/II-fold pyridoxal phosphate-dependent enzyme [Longimicrobiaceae bacterium]|nr:aminotransferase class I/II-fold pyridoxal phosphate-dependent enzyme [Longimicrobiaceae bacterium]